MAWIKLDENNKVIEKVLDNHDGTYIEAPDNVGPGMIKESDGTYSIPDYTLPYDYKRQQEYPDIGDQLDDLFKAGAFSTEMTAKIQAVKDKYPKE